MGSRGHMGGSSYCIGIDESPSSNLLRKFDQKKYLWTFSGPNFALFLIVPIPLKPDIAGNNNPCRGLEVLMRTNFMKESFMCSGSWEEGISMRKSR